MGCEEIPQKIKINWPSDASNNKSTLLMWEPGFLLINNRLGTNTALRSSTDNDANYPPRLDQVLQQN